MSKDVLIELLKKTLEERLKYIENRSDEHVSALQHTKSEFEKFTNVIDNLVKMRKEKEVAELQEKERVDKGSKEDNKKKDDKKKNDKTNTNTKSSSSSNATTTTTATTSKKTLKPAQSSANIITQKQAKSSKANLTIETGSKGKRTQTPGGGKRTKTEPSNNVSRNTMPVSSSARGSVQGGGKSGNSTNRNSSKPSTKKSAVSKGKGDKTSASKDKNVSTPSSSASTTKTKNEKALTTTTTTTKFQPIIETKEETTVNDVVVNTKQEQTLLSKVIEPKTLLETLQEKLLISEHIFPYLTENEKMNLLFTNKKLFIKNLQEVFTLKKEAKLKSLNVLIGQTIDDKIDELKNVSTHILLSNNTYNRVSLKKTY